MTDAFDDDLGPVVQAAEHGVYIHFPYCVSKCPYCDFNSHAVSHDDRRYADAVLSELGVRASELSGDPLSSIYFGGGTPSLWSPEQVARVLEGLDRRFARRTETEVTLEANPGTLDDARLPAYASAGVNRFSIGVQSFDDRELGLLGRKHDGPTAVRAVKRARAAGASVSLDLIYGLPGQDWSHVRTNLDRALALEPDHISAYTLTIEPDTPLARRTRLGLFRPMPDDDQAELIERVSDHLDAHGFRRYEISSYARPGRASRHNCLYWAGGAYLGLGAGAHSYLRRPRGEAIRCENVRNPEAYIQAALSGSPALQFREDLNPTQVLADRLMVALRVVWGIDPRDFTTRDGASEALTDRLVEALRELEDRGWVTRRGSRYGPTATGFLFNDAIAMALMEVPHAVETATPGAAREP